MPNNDDKILESPNAEEVARGGKARKIGAAKAAALVLLAAAVACMALSCSSAKDGWLLSYEDARDEARKTGKDVLFCFTGSDWDEAGNVIFAALEKNTFTAGLDDRFILCRLDIVYNTDLMEREQLETNFLLAGRYAVEDFPFIVLLTSEGDVYGRGAFRPLDDSAAEEGAIDDDMVIQEALAFIASFDENRERIVSLKNAIREAEGVERARRIDEFLAAVDPSQYSEYDGLIRSVVELDPENETGLRGDYLLQAAWLDAAALFQEGKMEEAAACFMDTLSDPAMTPALKQEALYLAAGMHAAAIDTPAEKIIALLEQAIAADPESPNVEMINQIIEGISLQIQEAETQEN